MSPDSWELREARSIDDLALALAQVARALGLRYHALVHHGNLARLTRSHLFVQNYPAEWVELFARSGLHRHDPAQRIAAQRLGGFSWEDMPRLMRLTHTQQQQIEDTKRAGLVRIHGSASCPPRGALRAAPS